MFDECLIYGGREFQILGLATAKAQSPDLETVIGVLGSSLLPDLS